MAGQQEVAHLRSEGGDDIGAVQQLATLGQDVPGLDGGQFELFLALLVLADAITRVGRIEVGVLDDLPDAVQPALDLDQLLFHGFQGSTLFARDAVHLLVEQLDQGADVALGEHVRSQLVDDQLLELLGRQSGTLAGLRTLLDFRLADVVGVLAALGFGGGQRPAA
ncbi:MAG: hypothetical protein OXD50_09490 [Chloroflexi bacterium]|nr:hypothetical protein [Chloroflexota bacterium]